MQDRISFDDNIVDDNSAIKILCTTLSFYNYIIYSLKLNFFYKINIFYDSGKSNLIPDFIYLDL